MVTRALLTVAAGDMPIVASAALRAFAGFVVAFRLGGVFADLAMIFHHRFGFRL